MEKFDCAETCTSYDVAPPEGFQIKIGAVEIFMALSDGENKAGAAGPATMVVNCQTVDHELVPNTFDALIRQKYFVLFDKLVTEKKVFVIPF